MDLVDIVRRTLRQHQLASPTTRLLVALSGGPDSMALLHVLHVLHRQQSVTLAGVVHFNHRLRDQADADQQFCAAAAAALDLPFITAAGDVRAFAREQQRSIEDAAHVLRYAFYARAVRETGSDLVAVGHTRDDQAETFLLRLLRGAGARGLGAMHLRSGIVVRPLLDASRDDVAKFLDKERLSFLHDATNLDRSIPRNRIRAELLPLIVQRFNPSIVDVLSAEADLARADELHLGALTDEWCSRHLHLGSGQWRLELEALVSAPRAVAWRAMLRAMTAAAGGRLVGSAHVRRAWAVVTGEAGPFDAPGHRVQREDSFLVLTGRVPGSVDRARIAERESIPFHRELPVPGEVLLPAGLALTAEVAPAAETARFDDRFVAVVPKERVAGGLAVRTRRPGDRLKASAVGHRKLQDLFVDRKVPRHQRDTIPIVVDTQDRIVWVAGHALDRDFRVSDPVQAVVILRLKGVGGSF